MSMSRIKVPSKSLSHELNKGCDIHIPTVLLCFANRSAHGTEMLIVRVFFCLVIDVIVVIVDFFQLRKIVLIFHVPETNINYSGDLNTE